MPGTPIPATAAAVASHARQDLGKVLEAVDGGRVLALAPHLHCDTGRGRMLEGDRQRLWSARSCRQHVDTCNHTRPEQHCERTVEHGVDGRPLLGLQKLELELSAVVVSRSGSEVEQLPPAIEETAGARKQPVLVRQGRAHTVGCDSSQKGEAVHGERSSTALPGGKTPLSDHPSDTSVSPCKKIKTALEE